MDELRAWFLRALAIAKLVARAQALQATEITEDVPAPAAPGVLAPEAAVALVVLVLLVRYARRILAEREAAVKTPEAQP